MLNRVEIKITKESETISMVLEEGTLLEDVLDFVKRAMMAKGHAIDADEDLILQGPNKEGCVEFKKS